MKPHKIILTVLFVFIYMGLNAQIFVGGNLGFSVAGGSTDNGSVTTNKPSAFNFNISPIAGNFLTDNVAAGLSLNFLATRTVTPGTPETVNTSNTFGLAPFVRYYAVRIGKFSVFGQANLGFSYGGSKSKTDGVTTDGPKTTALYLNVVPNLAYVLNDRISLEMAINIFNFGFNYTSTKSGNVIDRSSSFGIGAGLNKIVTVGDISIGAIYKFK